MLNDSRLKPKARSVFGSWCSAELRAGNRAAVSGAPNCRGFGRGNVPVTGHARLPGLRRRAHLGCLLSNANVMLGRKVR